MRRRATHLDARSRWFCMAGRLARRSLERRGAAGAAGRAHARWWALGAIVLGACGQSAALAPPPQVLVRTDAASDADCPHGGSIISAGVDGDGDGVLQDDEVATRTPVCMPAPSPLRLLVRLDAESPGAQCSAGGTAVRSGLDRDRDGDLDDGEVSRVDYLCREALLTRFAAEPPGPRCAVGGVELLAGRDRDGDGALQDDEVETTELECGDVLSRDVAIRSDADAAALAAIRVITGTLRIELTSIRTLSLPRLEHVGGSLRVVGNMRLIRLDLPALHTVDGDLALGASDLSTVSCPQLRRVGRFDLELIALEDLSGFPALAEVDGDVRITGTLALVSADLPLTSIGGDVAITANEELAHVVWRLSGRVGRIEVSDNARLDTLDLSVRSPSATTATGPIDVRSNDELAHFALQADEVRTLSIAANPAIADISLKVDRFESDVSISGGAIPFSVALDSSRFGSLDLDGRLTISGPLGSLRSEAFVHARGLVAFEGTLLRTLDGGVFDWSVTGGLRITDNPRLTGGTRFLLLGDLHVANNALLQDLSFVSLWRSDQIGGVVITGNPLLASVPALARIMHVQGSVRVEQNPRLTTLFGPSLRIIDGTMRVAGNAALTSLGFPDLVQVGPDLEVSSNAALQTLELPALTEVADQLLIAANSQLHHIDFSALAHGGDFQVLDNPRLPACEVLAIFAHTTGLQAQSGNDDDATCAPAIRAP